MGTAAGTDTYLAATSAAVSFTIAPKNVTTATVTGVEAQYYTGKEVVLPQLAVTGYTAGTDYNVSYQNNTKVGTATVTITFTGNYTGTISRTFAVLAGNDADLPLKNKIYAVGKYKYKVTKSAATGGTVELKAPVKKNMKQAKAVNFVKINGYRFKVTSIAPNAFKDNKKLKQFTIGTNIVKIGKNAFYKAKNLKKVTIKTTKLKTKKVGKKAFARIYSKAVIRVPKKKVKTYQKFLKKAGLPGQAKVK